MSPIFTLGPSVTLKFDGRILAAAFGEELFQRNGGTLHLVRIVLRFDGEADAAFFEPIKNFGNSHRLGAFVLDGADNAAFDNDKPKNVPGPPGFAFERDVVEAAGVPQRHKVAVEGFFVKPIAFFGEDHRAQRVLWDAARTAKFHSLYNIIHLPGGRCRFRFRRIDGRLRGLQLRRARFSRGRLRGLRFGGRSRLRNRFKRVRVTGLRGRWFGRCSRWLLAIE
jgi:hypothetical protein